MNSFDYERHVLALNDVGLEKLVRKWADCQVRNKYKLSMRYGGSGDLGRDVVGFYTDQKHEGDWDNYQCKQYGKALPTNEGMCELGKILYFAYRGNFTCPKNYYFVAPRGINKNLKKWILNPSQLRKNLIEQWDKYCRYDITKSEEIHLTNDLEKALNAFDFSKVQIIDLDKIVFDPAFRSVLVDEFGGELLSAPNGKVPSNVHESEFIYVNKVLDVYSEYDQKLYAKPEDIVGHEEFEDDFIEQRERFYSAEAFRAFYRDNTVEGTLENFENEILKGIKPTLRLRYSDSFERMCTVLSEAGKLQPSGKLAIHGKIDVKQGYCHQFANEDLLHWRKK
ncbi:ABC-three component system protein [Vibrio splendidus]